MSAIRQGLSLLKENRLSIFFKETSIDFFFEFGLAADAGALGLLTTQIWELRYPHCGASGQMKAPWNTKRRVICIRIDAWCWNGGGGASLAVVAVQGGFDPTKN